MYTIKARPCYHKVRHMFCQDKVRQRFKLQGATGITEWDAVTKVRQYRVWLTNPQLEVGQGAVILVIPVYHVNSGNSSNPEKVHVPPGVISATCSVRARPFIEVHVTVAIHSFTCRILLPTTWLRGWLLQGDVDRFVYKEEIESIEIREWKEKLDSTADDMA